jgi:hypothetical protein
MKSKSGDHEPIATMKLFPYSLIILAGLAPLAWSQPSEMRDASTHEQLVMTYRKAAQEDPMRNMPPAKGADPSVVNQPKDLISQSDIICYNGTATLVPKRAILNLPAAMQERLKFQQGSKIVSWLDFFAINRGWISTVEVTRVQAEGNEALKEEISARIGKSTNLVVATYMGGPISVLPLKTPAENQTAKAE